MAGAGLLFAWTVSASASIELRLVDGTHVRAEGIGPETNSRHIALRIQSDRIVLTRLVPWRRVDSARIGDQTFARDILQTYFRQKSRNDSLSGERSTVRLQLLSARYSAAPPSDPFADDDKSLKESAPVLSEKRPAVVPDGCCDPRAHLYEAPRFAAGREYCYPVLPLEATVIGVREDPLSAYGDLLQEFFPDGVPVSETPFVLDMLRARKDYDVFTGGHPAAEKRLPPEPLPPHRETVQPIRTLSVDALPISAHGKVDWDALAVEITAFDRFGLPTAVRGTLRATLWGRKQRLIQSVGEHFFAEPGRIEKVATWTRMIENGSLHEHPQPNRLILPLPRPLPDHDLRRAAFGELHVQLAVPGEGVFETTERNVLLRHRSVLRDRNLVETGSRFFAEESTHGSRMPGGLTFRNFSSGPNGRVLTVQP